MEKQELKANKLNKNMEVAGVSPILRDKEEFMHIGNGMYRDRVKNCNILEEEYLRLTTPDTTTAAETKEEIAAVEETKYMLTPEEVKKIMQQDRPTDIEIAEVEEVAEDTEEEDIPNGIKINGSPKPIDRKIDFKIFVEKLGYMADYPIEIEDTEVNNIKRLSYNGKVAYWQPKDVLNDTVDLFTGELFKESDNKYFKGKSYKVSNIAPILFNTNREKAIVMLECAVNTNYTSIYKGVEQLNKPPITIPTENNLADKFKATLNGQYVLNIDIGDKDKGRFMVYNGLYWEIDKGRKHLQNKIDQFSNSLLTAPITNEAEEKIIREQYRKLNNCTSRNAIINLLKYKIQIENKDLDSNRDLINLKNCTLNLKTLQVQEHKQEDMITRIANCNYIENADMTLIKKVVHDCFENNKDDIKCFETTMGAAICGELNKLLIWLGSGDNGKSLLKKIFTYVLGMPGEKGYSATPNKELFLENSIPRDPNAPTPERMIFKTARLVFISEPGKGRTLNEEELKIIVTHEGTSGRELNANTDYFTPISSIIMDSNNLPALPSTEWGVMKRILVLPFPHKFVLGIDMDITLEEKLKNNKDSVFRYLIHCVEQYKKYGIYISYNAQAKTDYYEQKNDIMQNFIDECLILNSGINCRKTEVYKVYKEWAEDNKYPILNSNDFREELAKKGIECKKISVDRYIGVKLKNIK